MANCPMRAGNRSAKWADPLVQTWMMSYARKGGGRTKKEEARWTRRMGAAVTRRFQVWTAGRTRAIRRVEKRKRSGLAVRGMGATSAPGAVTARALAAICGCSFFERSFAIGTRRASECGGSYSESLYSRPHTKTHSARTIAVPAIRHVGFRSWVQRCTKFCHGAPMRQRAADIFFDSTFRSLVSSIFFIVHKQV